jgi:hypothetical protein
MNAGGRATYGAVSEYFRILLTSDADVGIRSALMKRYVTNPYDPELKRDERNYEKHMDWRKS